MAKTENGQQPFNDAYLKFKEGPQTAENIFKLLGKYKNVCYTRSDDVVYGSKVIAVIRV